MNTPVSPDEAREALNLIETTTRQMRRALAYGGMPYFLIIWGVVWTLGFGASYFLGPNSPQAGMVWMVLDILGAVASFGVGAYLGQRVRSSQGLRIGLYWLAWMFYAALILYFAHPQGGDQISLLISLFAMMGYVSSGLLYRSRFLVSLGLAVTVFIVVGYLLLPSFFNLWMALLGGGSLIAAGIYILRTWRES